MSNSFDEDFFSGFQIEEPFEEAVNNSVVEDMDIPQEELIQTQPVEQNQQPQQPQNNQGLLNKLETVGPCIPAKDTGYIEYQQVDVPNATPLKVKFDIPAKPKLQHEVEMWDIINKFETDAWSPKNVGIKTGWDTLDAAFDGGLKSGFVVIGGDSNLGKSAFISQLAWQISENNDDVYVMDFSLDDPMPDKLARVIGSGSKVLLNAVKTPNNYANIPLMLVRRKEALNKLRTKTDTYRAYDANFSTFVEEIEEEIKRIKIELDAAGQCDKKVVVFIDNMHDLNIRDYPSLVDKQKFDFIAQWCSDLAIKFDIPVICSAELKKLNGTRRAILDDIREAVKIKYEAKAILMVYNEVHYKGESAEVYFLRANSPLKQPVFEVHFSKNKLHSYKGRLFFEFYPEMARMEEPDQQSIKHYQSVVFGN